MVFYSEVSIEDLENILHSLVHWEKHPLSVEHAIQYVDDIRAEADTICKKLYHTDTVHPLHKKYGDKIHRYSRNRKTQWHIIYVWNDVDHVAVVTKILNNYLIQ